MPTNIVTDVVLTEIKGLRGLLILCTIILSMFGVVNTTLNVTRIIILEQQLTPARAEVKRLQHELDTKKCHDQPAK